MLDGENLLCLCPFLLEVGLPTGPGFQDPDFVGKIPEGFAEMAVVGVLSKTLAASGNVKHCA